MGILKGADHYLKLSSEKTWRFIAKALRFIGGVGFLVVMTCSMLLIAYYSITRPHVPQPNYDWTVQLRWSFNHPSYGTASENAFLIHLFRSSVVYIVLLIASDYIRNNKLDGR